MYAVVEVDEDSVARGVTLKNTQKEAIEYALLIAKENEYSAPESKLRELLEEDGYFTEGWTVCVVLINQ